MDDKVSNGAASRQIEAWRRDALLRAKRLQHKVGEAVGVLEDSGSNAAAISDAADWINTIYLAAGSKVAATVARKQIETLARMHFFAMFHVQATWLNGQRDVHALEIAAEEALRRLAHTYALQFRKLWDERESTDTLSLIKSHLVAWLEKAEWTKAGCAPGLELLHRARLGGNMKPDTLRRMWLRWIRQPENDQILPPYEARSGGRPRRDRKNRN